MGNTVRKTLLPSNPSSSLPLTHTIQIESKILLPDQWNTALKLSILDSAGVLLHLAAQIRRRSVRVIAQSIASSIFRNKDQELVVGHVQTELRIYVVVVLGGLVTGTAGAVESRTRVDARSSNVTAVLARDGIASSAGGCWVGKDNGGRGQESSQSGELHDGYFILG